VCLPRTLASLLRLYPWIANKVLYVGTWQSSVCAIDANTLCIIIVDRIDHAIVMMSVRNHAARMI
jgi:hypothetical protein